MQRAHIQIVGWNHQEFLEACLHSCLRQTVRLPVVYLDNASSDGSADFVRTVFPEVQMIHESDNRGYAGGHNAALRAMPDSEIAILLNPDLVLDEHFVEEIVKPFSDPQVGAVVPLLLRGGEEGKEKIIDSIGIALSKSLRGMNRFENVLLSDAERSPHVHEYPWGLTGAAVALRRHALNEIAIDGEIFDEDLHSYREDVDLSWRLRQKKWKIVSALSSRASHVRAARKGKRKSAWVQQLSWRNFFLVLIKSVPSRTLVSHFIPLFGESVLRCLQGAVTPSLWPAWGSLLRSFPLFFRKRHIVFQK